MHEVLPDFLHFIGGRPLVGYYLEFDVAMLDKYVTATASASNCPIRASRSRLYHERKYGNAPPGTACRPDLRAMLRDLGSPRSTSTTPSTTR